jgi:hypothetical protein
VTRVLLATRDTCWTYRHLEEDVALTASVRGIAAERGRRVRPDVSITSSFQETTEEEIFCRPVPSKQLLNWNVQRSGRIACAYHPDRGETLFRNAGIYLPNYTVSSQRSLCSTVQFMFSLKCKESEL